MVWQGERGIERDIYYSIISCYYDVIPNTSLSNHLHSFILLSDKNNHVLDGNRGIYLFFYDLHGLTAKAIYFSIKIMERELQTNFAYEYQCNNTQ
jgi:lantibiotic modifying enzyme